MNVRKVLSLPDSDVYHRVRRGRVMCGLVSFNRNYVLPVEEANRKGNTPCGNCWRQRSQIERVASIGVDDHPIVDTSTYGAASK